MLIHTKGNLIDLAEQGEFDVIVHGCNCQNTMGSGIAAEIRARYPKVYVADLDYLLSIDGVRDLPVNKLGNYSKAMIATLGDERFHITVINAYTQVQYLPRGIDHFEYESFAIILRKLAAAYPDQRFGFPYIGMGLAGGNGFRIMNMLEDFAAKIESTGGSATLVEFA